MIVGAAGQSADVTFLAKDAKGFQKSLGGDVFTVSWQRLGQDEPATTGTSTPFPLLNVYFSGPKAPDGL